MNWLEEGRRMAIYHRDGGRCACCSTKGGPHGYGLTVDHIHPAKKRGTNADNNLITMCNRCNSAKQERPLGEFLKSFLKPRGYDPRTIERRIMRQVEKPLDDKAAKEALKARKEAKVALRKRGGGYAEFQAVARRNEFEAEQREEKALRQLAKTGTPAQRAEAEKILKQNARNRRRRKTVALKGEAANKTAREAKTAKTKKQTAEKTAAKPRGPVQTTARGAKYIITPSGKKRYVGERYLARHG